MSSAALAVDAATPVDAGAAVPAHCFHCGDANPPGVRWRADIDGVDAHFCCAGCLAVTQTIRAAGLQSFYVLRDDATASPGVALMDTDWQLGSDAAAAAGLIRSIGASQCEVTLLLDGMRCGACVWLLETWLRQQGVREATVNFATRRARLQFDPAKTGLAEILGTIARIGYRGYPYDPRRREALVRGESRALLLRTALALLGMMQVMMFAIPAYVSADGIDAEYQALMNWASLILTLPVVFYSGAPFFIGAWRDFRIRRAGMDAPIALGIAGAFAASAWATVTGSPSLAAALEELGLAHFLRTRRACAGTLLPRALTARRGHRIHRCAERCKPQR